MVTENELFIIAKCFRETGKKIAEENNRIFPHGWCGKLSRSLGVWLNRKYPNCEFDYVCGKRPSPEKDFNLSHAWIQYKDIIIDISGDQFEDCDDSIIVMRKELSKFHSTFELDLTQTKNVKRINIDDCEPENSIIKKANILLNIILEKNEGEIK